MSNEIGVTEAGDTRAALVSSIVQEVIAEKAQLLPLITDYSASAQPGSQSLGIPRRDTFSASAKAENTAVTNSEMTFSVDTISFAHKYVSAKIEDIARVQSSVDVPGEVVKEIGEAMAREADALILAQLKLGSTSTPDHILPYTDGTNDDIELADITGARSLLRAQGVMFNDESNYLLVSPEQEAFLLGIDGLIDASKYGSEASIQSGEIGKVFGFRVVVSDLLTANQSIFFNKAAVGFASQMNFKLEYQRDLDNLADHYVGSGLMGAKVMAAGKKNIFLDDGH